MCTFLQEQEDESDTDNELEDRNRVMASPISPLTPLETPTNAPDMMNEKEQKQWQQQGTQYCKSASQIN